MIDLREQVVSFQPQPVITEDNLVVEIDTVLYFQVTDARAAAYEIASFLQGVEQLTVTTLRNVVGSMDLERTLTSRDTINSQLRGVLDEATGKWGLRVNRVEIKAIDPPQSIKDAMEKQMRAERDKRAAILGAEGQRQSQILTAEGDKQAAVLRAEGNRTAAILKAEGQARAIDEGSSVRAPQRPRPQTARLSVSPDAAAAGPGPGKHVLGNSKRGHLRPARRVPRLHPGAAQVIGHPRNLLRQLGSARCRRCGTGGHKPPPMRSKARPRPTATRPRRHRARNDRSRTGFFESRSMQMGTDVPRQTPAVVQTRPRATAGSQVPCERRKDVLGRLRIGRHTGGFECLSPAGCPPRRTTEAPCRRPGVLQSPGCRAASPDRRFCPRRCSSTPVVIRFSRRSRSRWRQPSRDPITRRHSAYYPNGLCPLGALLNRELALGIDLLLELVEHRSRSPAACGPRGLRCWPMR